MYGKRLCFSLKLVYMIVCLVFESVLRFPVEIVTSVDVVVVSLNQTRITTHIESYSIHKHRPLIPISHFNIQMHILKAHLYARQLPRRLDCRGFGKSS